VADVVKQGCGYGWDGVCLAVAMAQSVTPHLPLGMEEGEELCRGRGFEYVEAEAKGRNEYGGRSSVILNLPGLSEHGDVYRTWCVRVIEKS